MKNFRSNISSAQRLLIVIGREIFCFIVKRLGDARNFEFFPSSSNYWNISDVNYSFEFHARFLLLVVDCNPISRSKAIAFKVVKGRWILNLITASMPISSCLPGRCSSQMIAFASVSHVLSRRLTPTSLWQLLQEQKANESRYYSSKSMSGTRVDFFTSLSTLATKGKSGRNKEAKWRRHGSPPWMRNLFQILPFGLWFFADFLFPHRTFFVIDFY